MIQGLEWIAIAAIILAFVVYGPKKIPELARALGKSRKEFREGQKEE